MSQFFFRWWAFWRTNLWLLNAKLSFNVVFLVLVVLDDVFFKLLYYCLTLKVSNIALPKKKLIKHLHNTSSFYSNRRLEQTPPQTCEDSFYPRRTPFSWWLTYHWTSTDLWRSRPFFDKYPPLVQIERFQSAPPALFLGPHSCPEGLNDVPLFLLFEFCPHFLLPHSIPEYLPHKLKKSYFQ